ncbi:hypothetical protein J7E91_15860 [Streptomyces sp. ISL-99]|uniref:alpha/beta hydrolase n=1 Tax=Streptomyces sp. ISL-99 TaxID=2819193 RepID=UPI001BEC1C85|nr:alpha/beta hydrolase [Streptomyces sp. ISL-99]MBT2526861.1 hypothetical protein [Streptomyces sp. ISL-99]
MLTWQQLRDLKCSELDDAADGWGVASNRADSARGRVDNEMTRRLEQTQDSESAEAAVKRLNRLRSNFQYIYTECGLVRTSLNSLAHELRTAQRHLREALDDAAGLRFTVNGDGSVEYPASDKNMVGEQVPGGGAFGHNGYLDQPRPGGPSLASEGPPLLANTNPNYAKAQGIADRIAHALREAHEIDGRVRSTLSKLKAQPGLTVDAATWTDAAKDADAVRGVAHEYLKEDIPNDKSPAERKAWWDNLTQEQREEYVAVYPDVIGNLDGIPAVVRDEANRDNLRLLIGELEGRGDEKAKTQLAGLKEMEKQLLTNVDERLSKPKEPPMYLLGISDQGRGRAIVSFGNPDTSKNVSAYVPGLGTALDEEFARNDVKRAHDTAVGARANDPSSAAIVWLGYDAPQIGSDADTLLGNADVAQDFSAERGATAYNSFMSGLGATNDNEDPHLTAIGHSYGSRTVGAATQEDGGIPGVDDIVLVGSPGVGVDRAEDLGVGKDHVFVGAAENDPVTRAPSGQQTGAGMPGFVVGGPIGAYLAGEIADQGDDDVWFGKDPASDAFGARRFVVDAGPLPLVGGDGPIDAHSNYFDPEKDPESAENIAAVVSGDPDLLTTEQHR